MPSIKTKKINEKVSEAAAQAKENPYVHKIIEDKELRENAVAALQSIKSAFEEAKGADSPADIIGDKKIQKQVKKAADQVKSTADDIASAGKKKKRHPVRKLLFVATIGAVVALVVSEDARKAALDALFGAEEEFEYTSNVASAAGSSSNGSS